MQVLSFALSLLVTVAVASSSAPVVAASASSCQAIRINCGGSADYVDAKGQLWMADAYFTAGTVQTVSDSNRDIANTIDDALFTTMRSTVRGVPFTYNIPVVNGEYKVILHFAELTFTAIGQRNFKVDVDGQTRITGIDIVKQSGGINKAVVQEATVVVMDGFLKLRFLQGAVGTPMISAIEVHCAGAAASAAVVAPTKPPTKGPTKAPTKAPLLAVATTKSPSTMTPTKRPTRAPTMAPLALATTKSPSTMTPTKRLTKAPTRAPLSVAKINILPAVPAPSHRPTKAPTKAPLAVATTTANATTTSAAASASIFGPIYTFNNGNVEDGKTCSDTEMALVQSTMSTVLFDAGGSVSSRHRQLLRSANRVPNEKQRRRQLRCTSCGTSKLCIQFSGLGCAKIRVRRLEQDEEQEREQRSLNTSPCANQVVKVDQALNLLANSSNNVTTTCRALLNAPRTIQCAEYTHDCDILGLTVMKSPTKSVVAKLDKAGTTSFCSSVGDITIQAETDFFLGQVSFSLRGQLTNGQSYVPFNSVEGELPYLVFGKTYSYVQNGLLPGRPTGTPLSTMLAKAGQKVTSFTGRTLLPGVYTVSAVSQDDPASGQSMSFTVLNC